MSTAVLLSGQARSFWHVYHNQKFYLYNRLIDPWFFVSVADDEQAKDMELLLQDFKHVAIEKVAQPELPEPALPKYQIGAYANSSSIQAILRQFWHLNRVWDFFQENFPDKAVHTVVRCRPDLFFRRLEGIPFSSSTIHVPYWGGYGGINDRFAVMGYDVAKHYFRTFTKIESLLRQGCPFHPETLLAQSTYGCVRRTLRAEFCIVRTPDKDGVMKMIEPDIRPGDALDYHADSI